MIYDIRISPTFCEQYSIVLYIVIRSHVTVVTRDLNKSICLSVCLSGYIINLYCIFAARAYRYCPTNASWKDHMSDYSECMAIIPKESTEHPVNILIKSLKTLRCNEVWYIMRGIK